MIKKGIEAINESLSKGQGTNKYPETNWISWKGGETKVLRFITDIEDTLVVAVHSMVDTHDGKKANFVCRSTFDAPCELCASDIYKRDSGYGIAVVREPRYEDGKLVGYEDQVVEYDEETPSGIVRKKKPVVGIVNQSMRNFWNYIALIHEKYGSLRDFDLEVHRQGSGTDTTYVSFPLPAKPIENMTDRYKDFVPDLEGFLTRIGSPEYYLSRLHGIEPEKDEGKKFPSTNSAVDSYNTSNTSNTVSQSDDIDEKLFAERLQSKMADSPYS